VRVSADAELRDVWVVLTPAEAPQVLEAFRLWDEEEAGFHDPGWHMHITDSGRELTFAIESH
jgi:hypothetical protein